MFIPTEYKHLITVNQFGQIQYGRGDWNELFREQFIRSFFTKACYLFCDVRCPKDGTGDGYGLINEFKHYIFLSDNELLTDYLNEDDAWWWNSVNSMKRAEIVRQLHTHCTHAKFTSFMFGTNGEKRGSRPGYFQHLFYDNPNVPMPLTLVNGGSDGKQWWLGICPKRLAKTEIDDPETYASQHSYSLYCLPADAATKVHQKERFVDEWNSIYHGMNGSFVNKLGQTVNGRGTLLRDVWTGKTSHPDYNKMAIFCHLGYNSRALVPVYKQAPVRAEYIASQPVLFNKHKVQSPVPSPRTPQSSYAPIQSPVPQSFYVPAPVQTPRVQIPIPSPKAPVQIASPFPNTISISSPVPAAIRQAIFRNQQLEEGMGVPISEVLKNCKTVVAGDQVHKIPDKVIQFPINSMFKNVASSSMTPPKKPFVIPPGVIKSKDNNGIPKYLDDSKN